MYKRQAWTDLGTIIESPLKNVHSILPFINGVRCTESPTVGFEDDKLRSEAFAKSRARYGYNRSLPFVLRTDVNSHLQFNPRYPQNKELQGYIDMLKKLNAAHVLTLRPIIEGIQMIQRVHQGTGHIGNDSIEAVQAKLTRIWHESDPYFKLSPQLDNSKQTMEGALFGDQAEVAGTLWQTLVFPRIVTLDEKIYPKMMAANKMYAELESDFYEKRNKVRAPFYRLQKDAFLSLIKMDYSAAASQIAAIAREYPGLFPDFAVDKIKAILAQQTQAE